MTLETRWLKCRVTEGILPMEYAVSCASTDGNIFSFFALEEDVDAKNNLVQVDVLECQQDSCLIYIPSDPLEGISRTVKVFTKDLISHGT